MPNAAKILINAADLLSFGATFLTTPLSLDKRLHCSDFSFMALRRLGPDPHEGGATTPALSGCPDIFELETGDFAIVGEDITAKTINQLPKGATCGPDERIVLIPRKTLVLARPDIPKV